MAAYDGEFSSCVEKPPADGRAGYERLAVGVFYSWGGGAAPVVTTYHKRAWKSDPLPAEYVEWDTTDPNGAYPGGGTLFPALGVVLYTWTT